MKKNKCQFLLIVVSFYLSTFSFAQTINWKSFDSKQNVINVNYSLDYSSSFGIGYARKLDTKLPLILSSNFSIPSGQKLFDDFKSKIGGQIGLLNKSNFMASISLFGVYRKYQTNLAGLQNFGSDMKGSFGYYKPKWFLTAEVGFDKAIVTYFKHSKKFKDEIYANVVDGWYEPATGGNFYYGISLGYTLKKVDITANFGKVISQDFKTTPLIPYYAQLGCNIKLGQRKASSK